MIITFNILISRSFDTQQLFMPYTKNDGGKLIIELESIYHFNLKETKTTKMVVLAVAEDNKLNDLIERLILCESRGNEKAIGDNGKAFGILQFHQGTFDKFGSLYNLCHDNIWNPNQQREIAKKMLENGGWKHWTNCYLKISSGGVLE